MDDFDYNLFVGEFYKTLFYCLHGTLYIGFYDDIEFFDISGLDL